MQLKFLCSLLLASLAMAQEALKPVLVTYPEDTPAGVIDDAKKAIKEGGGKITHEYNLINGFAASAPQGTLDGLKTLDASISPTIDDDTVVSINK